MLHITNGDSTRLGLEQSGLPGTFQAWRDVLHDGPVPTRLTAGEFRRVRSEFIASNGFGDVETILRGYEQEDAAVERWVSATGPGSGAEPRQEMLLWFEHDLYDQLLLIRLLSMLPPDAGANVSLVCSDVYLGPLSPGEFPALFDARRPVTPAQIALAKRAWYAYGADTPGPLLEVFDGDTSALPFLAGALARHFEDYPDERGLSRSERQILEVIAGGADSPRAIFAAWTAREERVFMGDWPFWGIVRGLAEGPEPLVRIFRLKPEATDSRGFRLQAEVTLQAEGTPLAEETLPPGSVALTPAGREVLAGRADRILLNGIDRWMGGVHLTPARPWRRPPGSARPASS